LKHKENHSRIGAYPRFNEGKWRWTRHTNDFFSKSRSKHSENPQLTERFHSLSSVLVRDNAGLKATTRQSPKPSRNLSI